MQSATTSPNHQEDAVSLAQEATIRSQVQLAQACAAAAEAEAVAYDDRGETKLAEGARASAARQRQQAASA